MLTEDKMMKAICRDRLSSTQSTAARGIGSVAPDLDKMLGNKSLADLEKLERQVKAKLESNEPIDVDYWEHLERSILTYKARAKLKSISTSMLEIRSRNTSRQQILEANALKQRLRGRLASNPMASLDQEVITPGVRHPLDPEPLSRIRPEDKSCKTMTLKDFADQIVSRDCIYRFILTRDRQQSKSRWRAQAMFQISNRTIGISTSVRSSAMVAPPLQLLIERWHEVLETMKRF